MVNYDINKDLSIFLSFPDQATPLTPKNNARIFLGSQPEKFKNIEARKKLGIVIQIKVCSSTFLINVGFKEFSAH